MFDAILCILFLWKSNKVGAIGDRWPRIDTFNIFDFLFKYILKKR